MVINIIKSSKSKTYQIKINKWENDVHKVQLRDTNSTLPLQLLCKPLSDRLNRFLLSWTEVSIHWVFLNCSLLIRALSAWLVGDYCSDGSESLVKMHASKHVWFSVCVQLITQYTFLDYVMGGCQINFTVCQRQLTCTHFKWCNLSNQAQ